MVGRENRGKGRNQGGASGDGRTLKLPKAERSRGWHHCREATWNGICGSPSLRRRLLWVGTGTGTGTGTGIGGVHVVVLPTRIL